MAARSEVLTNRRLNGYQNESLPISTVHFTLIKMHLHKDLSLHSSCGNCERLGKPTESRNR